MSIQELTTDLFNFNDLLCRFPLATFLKIPFLLQKSVSKMVVEIIVEAKVKAVKWVAMSVLGITLPLPLFVI